MATAISGAQASYSPATSPDRYYEAGTSEPDMAINGWRLIERIGAGGMGEVWRARHARIGVGAVKLLREELLADREARSRFRREARTLQRNRGRDQARGNGDRARVQRPPPPAPRQLPRR